MSRRYGVLLVGGYRTHQENHAAAFSEDPRCEIVAVTDEPDIPDRRRALNREMAAAYGVPCVPDLADALAMPSVDVVSMCADVERRARVAVACARAGKALFLDKPLAADLAGARRVVEATRAAGVPSQMYSFVNLPWAQAAKRCVDSGLLGRLLAVHADVLFAKGRSGTAPKDAVRAEQARPTRFTFVEAKRELFDLGVYAIGLCLWLAGRAAVEVFATTGNYFFREHAALDVEDFGAVAMKLEDGVTATATGGRIGFHSHPRLGPHRIVLVGAGGAETFDAFAPRLEVSSQEPPPVLPEPHPEDPMGMWRSTQTAAGIPRKTGWVAFDDEARWYPQDVRAFLDCLDGGREPEMNAARAAESVAVLVAAYSSAATGAPVAVEAP